MMDYNFINILKEIREEERKLVDSDIDFETTVGYITHANKYEALNFAIYKLEDLIQQNKRIKYISNNLFIDDYIPKLEVKNLMEKLNKEIRNCDTIEAVFKIKQQQILQELLESSDINE